MTDRTLKIWVQNKTNTYHVKRHSTTKKYFMTWSDIHLTVQITKKKTKISAGEWIIIEAVCACCGF